MRLQIVVEGRSYEVEFEIAEEDGSFTESDVARFAASMAQSMVVPTSVPGNGAPGEYKLCRSPVAGIVEHVCVQPGTEVQVDDLLFVLEAMKMETRVTAIVKGKMKSVCVASGDAVRVNQILGEFE